MRDIANRGRCSTAGIEGLSRQLADTQMCIRPGEFVRFAPHRNITLTSDRVHPYMQASARDALWRAASRRSISVNSAFRTLADQYVLYKSGGCGLAARPGRSNHQSGRAVDLANSSAARSAMRAAGCSWLGSRDPVHYDCPGRDKRSDTIRAFQRLWNINNPSDRISEDGAYGPATESRLARSPARGFAQSGCGGTTPDPDPDPDPDPPPTGGSTTLIGTVYRNSNVADKVRAATVRVVETGQTSVLDSGGLWRFQLSQGTYTVEASASGYVTSTRRCEVGSSTTWCSIEIARGTSPGTIIGTITEAGATPSQPGGPIGGANVLVLEANLETTTQPNGGYHIQLPPGTYTVYASRDGFETSNRRCVVEQGREVQCDISLASTTRVGTIKGVVYRNGNIRERVTGATVRVVETNAVVTSREGDGYWQHTMAPGTYTVEVSGPGVQTASRRCDVRADGQTWCSVNVRADSSGRGGGVQIEDIDGFGDIENPDVEDDLGETVPGEGVPFEPGSLTNSGGCAAGHAGGSGATLLGLVLLLALRRRRG